MERWEGERRGKGTQKRSGRRDLEKGYDGEKMVRGGKGEGGGRGGVKGGGRGGEGPGREG